MTFGKVFRGWKGGGDSKTLSTNPYRVISNFRGIDKRVEIAQTRGIWLSYPIHNGGQLKLATVSKRVTPVNWTKNYHVTSHKICSGARLFICICSRVMGVGGGYWDLMDILHNTIIQRLALVIPQTWTNKSYIKAAELRNQHKAYNMIQPYTSTIQGVQRPWSPGIPRYILNGSPMINMSQDRSFY